MSPNWLESTSGCEQPVAFDGPVLFGPVWPHPFLLVRAHSFWERAPTPTGLQFHEQVCKRGAQADTEPGRQGAWSPSSRGSALGPSSELWRTEAFPLGAAELRGRRPEVARWPLAITAWLWTEPAQRARQPSPKSGGGALTPVSSWNSNHARLWSLLLGSQWMSFVSDTASSWISISYKEEAAGVGQECPG